MMNEIVLNELKEESENLISEFILNYMKEHTYFTAETITIYYIIERLKEKNIEIEKVMYRYTSNYYPDYHKVKLGVFKELERLKKQGIIESYSKKTFKMVNIIGK